MTVLVCFLIAGEMMAAAAEDIFEAVLIMRRSAESGGICESACSILSLLRRHGIQADHSRLFSSCRLQ
jgi:hypothetical protein